MRANTWLSVARGGGLAHWTTGPLMVVAGIATGHISLILLGTASFGVGIWILRGTE